jgi:hypothetical protein
MIATIYLDGSAWELPRSRRPCELSRLPQAEDLIERPIEGVKHKQRDESKVQPKRFKQANLKPLGQGGGQGDHERMDYAAEQASTVCRLLRLPFLENVFDDREIQRLSDLLKDR